MSDFKVGDVVFLKSGSPLMTVHEIASYPGQNLDPGILCVWFDSGKRIEAAFHPATLQKDEEDA